MENNIKIYQNLGEIPVYNLLYECEIGNLEYLIIDPDKRLKKNITDRIREKYNDLKHDYIKSMLVEMNNDNAEFFTINRLQIQNDIIDLIRQTMRECYELWQNLPEEEQSKRFANMEKIYKMRTGGFKKLMESTHEYKHTKYELNKWEIEQYNEKNKSSKTSNNQIKRSLYKSAAVIHQSLQVNFNIHTDSVAMFVEYLDQTRQKNKALAQENK